jgi:hypothetical protein
MIKTENSEHINKDSVEHAPKTNESSEMAHFVWGVTNKEFAAGKREYISLVFISLLLVCDLKYAKNSSIKKITH